MRIDPYKHKERYENWKEKVLVFGWKGDGCNNVRINCFYFIKISPQGNKTICEKDN